jgi:ABC-type uncharacterized transport system substrate-binding protein
LAFRSLARDLIASFVCGLRRAANGPRSILAAAIITLLCSITLMVPARLAEAHPHAWIDVAVRVAFDKDGNAVGLHQVWLFDELYTAFAMDGLAKKGAQPAQKDIDGLMHRNMTNLADFSYFTQVKHDGAAVALRKATEMSSKLTGARLSMSFYLPFKTTIDPRGKPLQYAVYDPTYFIEVLHAKADDAIQLAGAPANCAHVLIEPTPSMEAVLLAQSLDRTQSAGDGLGVLFAQTVEIRCR